MTHGTKNRLRGCSFMKNNFGEKAYKLDNTEIFQGIPVFKLDI